MSDHFDRVADRLEAIAEELADTALTELSSAVRRGDQKRPATERTLTQARRAIEKAAHLLRGIGADNDNDNDIDSDDRP
ncbi:unannotated protein [freshwater metagenome]|uniref:Unannotated protein n=1 Tax=freshwater metagenome TaxID=449393 RepID=A0A6J7DEW2_9ZZZZ|nr:hypothetical protein [Actinomycetota bacterium]